MKKVFKKHFIAGKHNDHQPHALRDRGIVAIGYISIIAFMLVLAQSRVVGISNLLGAILPNVLVDLANEERIEFDSQSLTINPLLVQAAQLKANDMAERGYFSHVSPDGFEPWHWFEQSGYPYLYAGENLAMDFHDSDAVTEAWMASPGHRANILSKNFTEIGIAKATGRIDGRRTTFVVQMFGQPRAIAPVAQAAPVQQVIPEPQEELILGAAELPDPEIETATTEQVEETPTPTEPEVIEKTQTFIAVAGEKEEPSTITGIEEYSEPTQRALTSTSALLKVIYFLISGLILISIASILLKQIRLHHVKQITAGAALMGFMSLLLFITHNLLFAEVIIR